MWCKQHRYIVEFEAPEHNVRETTFMFATAAMTAPDGRCKTLDAAADGYVRAEACVVIKLG